MWVEKYFETLIQNVDDMLGDADDKGETGWSIVVESLPTIRSSTSSAVLRNPPVETAVHRPIAPIPRQSEDSIFQLIPHIQLSSYVKEGHQAPTLQTTFTDRNIVLPRGLEEFEQAITDF